MTHRRKATELPLTLGYADASQQAVVIAKKLARPCAHAAARNSRKARSPSGRATYIGLGAEIGVVPCTRPSDDRFTNNNLSRLHLFCLLVNEPRSHNHVQGGDTRDIIPTFSCCLAHWRFLVRYATTGDGTAERIKTIVLSSSYFFNLQSKKSAETWNKRSPSSKEHFGSKKLEIYLRQKSPRF